MEGRKERNVLFNDALNTFYLRLYGRKEGRKEMFYFKLLYMTSVKTINS